MSSREIPQLHVDEEFRVSALIFIHIDADTMNHIDLGQKPGKNSSTKIHRVPMGLVSFRK